jgi:hypothetical protein
MNRRTTQRIITRLAEAGELEIRPNQGIKTEKGHTNFYKIRGGILPPPDAQGAAFCHNGATHVPPKPSVLNHQFKAENNQFLQEAFKAAEIWKKAQTELITIMGQAQHSALLSGSRLDPQPNGYILNLTRAESAEWIKRRFIKQIRAALITQGANENFLLDIKPEPLPLIDDLMDPE